MDTRFKNVALDKSIAKTLYKYIPKGVNIAVNSFEALSTGTLKNPLVLSNTAKCMASFNRLIISSSVLELHTGCTI